MTIGKFIYGNWKMNGLLANVELAKEVSAAVKNINPANVEVGICPPFTILSSVVSALGETPVVVGAQDCHFNEKGAHTGNISPVMLTEIGVKTVILGHSERRADHFETSEVIAKKAIAAKNAGLKTIICVGETLAEREAGKAEEVVLGQVKASIPEDYDFKNLIIAYEPVWAIGTGKVASNEDIEKMHAAIRATLVAIFGENGNLVPIQYGGSVNAQNAASILAIKNVDGALVGGASLKAADFATIIEAAKNIVG